MWKEKIYEKLTDTTNASLQFQRAINDMKSIDKHTLLFHACNRIKATALHGIWDGRTNTEYFENCIWFLERNDCTIVFTKESGYHTGGWWKNPEYERCWHLSISFRSGKNKKILNDILENIFGQSKKFLWVEPPFSKEGKSLDVWHYRLFCDQNWQPIKPKGEVYNTHFTERNWKSFSEHEKKNPL